MFESTREIINKTIKEFNFTVYFISVISQLITGGYMIYLCTVGAGTIGLNIAMSAICLGYLVLSTVHFVAESKEEKKQLSRAKSMLKRVKLAIKTAMLAISVYGIYLADKDMSAMAIILATLSIIMWILEVLFEIIFSYVKIRSSQFIEALKNDIKPQSLAGGVVKIVKDKVADIADGTAKVGSVGIDAAIDVGAHVVKKAIHRFGFSTKSKGKVNKAELLPSPRDEEKTKV